MNDRTNDPPRFIIRFLRWFCPEHLLEEIEGDLMQRFERDVKELGLRRARQRLAWNSIRFFRLGIILRNRVSINLTNGTMFSSYLKMSLRSLALHKGTSFINVFGLVIGIASALTVLTIIRYELSFDRFHTDSDHIFRVVTVKENTYYNPGICYPMPEALKDQISGLMDITALHYHRELQVDVLDRQGVTLKKFHETDGCALVQPSFFKIFDFSGTDFKWIAGNPETALAEPFSIVLTRSMAEKYFSSLDVLDRTLRIEEQLDFKVTGVVEDLPPNTDFPITVFLSYSTYYRIQENEMKNDWQSVATTNQCFMKLPDGVHTAEIEKQIGRIFAAHVPKEMSKGQHFKLQPLIEVHQDSRFGNFNMRTVSKTTLWTLVAAGIVLLVVACINYINLATARSTVRAKEVGIRKVLGSRRSQLMFQFLSEAFLVAFFASILAIFAAQVIIDRLESLININLQHYVFLDWFALKCLLLIVVFITLLAGFYPALIVSRFDPISAMKNRLSTPGIGAYLRKTLVVIQFTATQIFIIGTFVVLNQLAYFRSFNLGFDKEGIVNVRLSNDYQGKINTLQEKLESLVSVSQVSMSSTTPSGLRRASWHTAIRRKETEPDNATGCEYQAIDANYLNLYGIRLVAGRNFSAEDSAGYLIINETLASEIGFNSPEESIGREMVMDGKDYTVIGVVADFHSRSLKEGLDKVALAVHPHMYRLANIKLNVADEQSGFTQAVQSTISEIESVWVTTFPDTAFEYRFLDDSIDAYYQQETRTSKLLQIFSSVLLVIGCLGLYGLISFIVSRKLKEVAIRKIFGASMLHVMALISKDYFKLVLLAFVLAVPVSWYYLEDWLGTFIYRIHISWWMVILPGLIVLMVALMAVSGQLLSAARANPANTLKYE